MEELTPLVIAAQQGDLDAFGRIVQRFQDMAYAIGYSMLGDAHLAEDAAQEAFIEAFNCLPRLREPAAFPGWFRRIAIKRGDRLARGRHRALLPLTAADQLPAGNADPADAVLMGELKQVVHAAIAGLPETERLATALFYIAGYSQQEIADCLEVPLSTVKKRLYSSRQRLRERMEMTAREHLQQQRPSHDERFARSVQFLIAVRTGDLTRVAGLLGADPTLITVREDMDDGSVRQYLPLAGRYTALHRAVEKGHSGLVRLLLDRHSDVNAATRFGETALHTAALLNRVDEAGLLLTGGANPNAAATNGMTPLHWAALRNHYQLVSLLLAHGADQALRDAGGRTALDWARLKDYRAVVALLQERLQSRPRKGGRPCTAQ